MSSTKPFLKWVGGKTQILDDVLKKFPNDIENYHEPFLGGGSVLLGLLSAIKDGIIRVKGTLYASDVNAALISLYKNIQSHPDILIKEIKIIIDDFNSCSGTEINRAPANKEEARSSQESYYYWIRSQFNGLSQDEKTSAIGSAMFLFLNKTCFRGVYREGPRGFNVPYGHYKKPTIMDETHIYGVSEMIKDVVFYVQSFEESLSRVLPEDFVYLDPPYVPETTTSFVSYTSCGFNINMHKSLFTICNTMVNNNVKIVMSNSDVPLIREAFTIPLYKVETIVCRRSINSTNPEAKTKEVLIESYNIAL